MLGIFEYPRRPPMCEGIFARGGLIGLILLGFRPFLSTGPQNLDVLHNRMYTQVGDRLESGEAGY